MQVERHSPPQGWLFWWVPRFPSLAMQDFLFYLFCVEGCDKELQLKRILKDEVAQKPYGTSLQETRDTGPNMDTTMGP